MEEREEVWSCQKEERERHCCEQIGFFSLALLISASLAPSPLSSVTNGLHREWIACRRVQLSEREEEKLTESLKKEVEF